MSCAGGADDFLEPDRERESFDGRLSAAKPGTHREKPRIRFRYFSPVEGAPQANRRYAFRRRTADAGDRPRPDEQSKISDARRALTRNRAAPHHHDLRKDRGD